MSLSTRSLSPRLIFRQARNRHFQSSIPILKYTSKIITYAFEASISLYRHWEVHSDWCRRRHPHCRFHSRLPIPTLTCLLPHGGGRKRLKTQLESEKDQHMVGWVHFTAAIPTLKMSCPLLLHLYNGLKKKSGEFWYWYAFLPKHRRRITAWGTYIKSLYPNKIRCFVPRKSGLLAQANIWGESPVSCLPANP